MESKKSLTGRSALFVGAIAKGMTQIAAAEAAGYSKASARDLMARPDIKAAIAETQGELREKTGYELADAARDITEELAAMRSEKQVPWMALSRHRELLAKLHGLLVDRIQLDQKRDIGFDLCLAQARTVTDVDVLIKQLEGVAAAGRLSSEHYDRIAKLLPIDVESEIAPMNDPFS